MATPASSAWHRRRAAAAGAASSFTTAHLPSATRASPQAPPAYPPRTAPAVPQQSPPPPPPTRRTRRAAAESPPPPPPAGALRAHVLLAKAAQAGALFFTALPVVALVLALAAGSCEWPGAALARPARGLVGYVEVLVRIAAGVGVVGGVVVFHAVTLGNLRMTRRALPRRRDLWVRAVFSRAEALRHLLALAVVGAVQVPGFAIIVHGFRISRVVRDRVAPAWIDLQICVVVGAIAGVAFAVAWQASAAYVLRVSPSRVAWRVRVKADLGYAAEPAAVVLGVAAAVAAVLALLMRGGGGEGGDLSVYEIALAATAAVEGAAAVKLDFSWLRRWWICVEAVGLCVLCWTLSSVIVNVLLSQPYDFVLEAKAAAAVPGEQRKAREANGGRRGAKAADPRVLNPLLFALNAAVRYPRADPTGVLGALALQDLCDSVSTSPAGRAPVFADAQGVVWHEILTACLFPIDKLSYRLWLRANSHRSELPALFQAGKMESAALYSGHGFGGADDGGDDVLGAATSWSMDNDDGVLFGDSQRIVHAAGALANLLVASRSPVENEDQYGVAQRTLVDAVTALLQCYVSCRAYNDGQLLQTRSVLSEAHSVPVTAEERDEQYYARLVEDALVRALRQIVTAFHAHIRGYLDAQEPRWSAKFNASLASFLDEVQ